ncbi:MAG: type II toxin-antitoxin system RelE/ParE family toxin [Clostridia bacterium]|nr:type II toxin-antitoxin system RelE/ParE family toxin [Clostridia bacterium]
MFEILFYENEKGKSEVWDFIDNLRCKIENNKDANVEFKQICYCLDLLQEQGTKLNCYLVKHIRDCIWELRPGNNRILFFYHKDNKYILLSCFRKKTQKTPQREIEKALRLAADYIRRFK